MIAKNSCDLMIKYEDLIQEPFAHVKEIADKLEVCIDVGEVIENSFNLRPPNDGGSNRYSKETLLHKGHFTNTKDNEWRSVLSEKLQDSIAKEFAWWFDECGYSIN